MYPLKLQSVGLSVSLRLGERRLNPSHRRHHLFRILVRTLMCSCVDALCPKFHGQVAHSSPLFGLSGPVLQRDEAFR